MLDLFSWNLFLYSPSVQVIAIIPGVYIVHLGISDTLFSITSHTSHLPESYQLNKLRGHSALFVSTPFSLPTVQASHISFHPYSSSFSTSLTTSIHQSNDCFKRANLNVLLPFCKVISFPLLDKIKLQIYNVTQEALQFVATTYPFS